MEYEKGREEGMGMAGTCGIFITAAAAGAAAMANVTFVAAAARGGEAAAAAAAAGNKANVSCKYFIATM